MLLGGAALAAALRSDDEAGGARSVALDLAKDSLVAFSPGGRGPEVAIPLAGRPTSVAAASGRVFVTTVDSATLTEVDGRTRRIVRVLPLQITPSAVAAAGNLVWVADRRRGVVVKFQAGYERPTARIAYPRPRVPGPAGLNVREPVSLASARGAVWVTDGSRRVTRIDARSGAVTQFAAGRTLDGVVSGAGAVWAFNSKTATVVRIDPRTGAVTDPIRIATRRGSDKPYPVGIATTPGTVWVLNGDIRDGQSHRRGTGRRPRHRRHRDGPPAAGHRRVRADGLGGELRRIGLADRRGPRRHRSGSASRWAASSRTARACG